MTGRLRRDEQNPELLYWQAGAEPSDEDRFVGRMFDTAISIDLTHQPRTLTSDESYELDRLRALAHERFAHPDWEYAETTGPAKAWNVEPPDGDGWVQNGFHNGGWERFDHHEEAYWMRPKPDGANGHVGLTPEQTDIVSAVLRLEQVVEERHGPGDVLYERLLTCDVPRLKQQFTDTMRRAYEETKES